MVLTTTSDYDYLMEIIRIILTGKIHNKNKEINTDCIEKFLKESSLIRDDWKVNVKEDSNDKYNLKVTLTLPSFVPFIHEETGELWYSATDFDLKWTEKDDKYVFYTNDENIYNLLELIME